MCGSPGSRSLPGDCARSRGDESCDTVLAVNSVAMWPNLGAGLAEIQRGLPDGHVVLSWHSGNAPSSTQRRLALPDVALDALHTSFYNVKRRDLLHSIAWQAQRRS